MSGRRTPSTLVGEGAERRLRREAGEERRVGKTVISGCNAWARRCNGFAHAPRALSRAVPTLRLHALNEAKR
jgi:hypothetical protein